MTSTPRTHRPCCSRTETIRTCRPPGRPTQTPHYVVPACPPDSSRSTASATFRRTRSRWFSRGRATSSARSSTSADERRRTSAFVREPCGPQPRAPAAQRVPQRLELLLDGRALFIRRRLLERLFQRGDPLAGPLAAIDGGHAWSCGWVAR